ncbi:MAG: methyltransferase [Bacteroidales bacterium]|nr:methyltransferase [Bacteroidales bacterium]MCF8402784.1 methyltransferase [Bacteroidales bacterium]
MRKPFQFKEFSIADDKCAMPLSTDAVLLGAWASTPKSGAILDIGTGCGIIALMLAQRSELKIDAIDIHQASAIQAATNFENSPWPEQLSAFHSDITSFAFSVKYPYELIVCNPPFYTNSLKSGSDLKNLSKHDGHLNFKMLVTSVDKLLSLKGKFCIIISAESFGEFVREASISDLSLIRKTIIYPKSCKDANRVLAEFSREKLSTPMESSLCIRNIDNSFTSEYITLTKSYYLNF